MLVNTLLVESKHPTKKFDNEQVPYVSVPMALVEGTDIVIQKDLRVYAPDDLTKPINQSHFFVHGKFWDTPLEPVPEAAVEDTVFFLGGNPIFGHMVFEYLPRLYMLTKIEQDYPKAIYIWPEAAKWLGLFHPLAEAIKNIPVVVAGPQRFRKVYIATQAMGKLPITDPKAPEGLVGPPFFHMEALEWVRNNTSCMSDKQTRRIYAARKGSHRLVLNDDAVQNALQALGFKVVYLEDYTIPEQINMVSSAETFVAPAGSGIGISLWAKGKVIELSHTSIDGGLGAKVFSNLLGNPYKRVDGMIDGPRGRDSNYRIDVEELKRAVG